MDRDMWYVAQFAVCVALFAGCGGSSPPVMPVANRDAGSQERETQTNVAFPPEYSVEETVQLAFLNRVYVNESEKWHSGATDTLFALAKDHRCKPYARVNAFEMMGVLADETFVQRIEDWITQHRCLLEEEVEGESFAVEAALDCLGHMAARLVPGAQATMVKMRDPSFWTKYPFEWDPPGAAAGPAPFYSAFKVLGASLRDPEYALARETLIELAKREPNHEWLEEVVGRTQPPEFVETPRTKAYRTETMPASLRERMAKRASAKWRPWDPRDPSHGGSPPVAQNSTETPPLATAHETKIAGDAQAELAQQALAAFAEIRQDICRQEWGETPADVERLMSIRTKFLRKDGPLREPKNDQEKIRGTQWMKLQRELLQLLETGNLTPQTPPFLCTTTTEKIEDRSIEVIRIGFRLPGSLKLFGASQSWPELSEGASRGTKSMEFAPNSTETRPIWGDFIIYMQRRDGQWMWLPFNS